MSIRTDALDAAVGALLQARAAQDATPGPRSRAAAEREFARLARLLAPRIRHFTARYGLADMAEDAEQACLIALHRAVATYDPTRARFTTFINWPIRAELQALRFRMRSDQRSAARQIAATTVSLDALTEAAGDDWLADPLAEGSTEAGASAAMAERLADKLTAGWIERRTAQLARPGRCDGPRACPPGALPLSRLARMEAQIAAERALVRAHLAGSGAPPAPASERERHAVRRALADIGRHARPLLRRA